MERSTTAPACFNNLLCIWDETLPSLESTTSWHMIQTSRISKNVRCLWNSDKKLKSNPDWSPVPERILSPLFWKLRSLQGTVLTLEIHDYNPLHLIAAWSDLISCEGVSEKHCAQSSRNVAAEGSPSCGKGSSWQQNQPHVQKRGGGTILAIFCRIINYPKPISLKQQTCVIPVSVGQDSRKGLARWF